MSGLRDRLLTLAAHWYENKPDYALAFGVECARLALDEAARECDAATSWTAAGMKIRRLAATLTP